MRKKTISYLIDNIFWGLVYILPLICFGIVLAQSGIVGSFSSVCSQLGFGIFADSPIYLGLDALFGATGIFPLFASADLLLFGSYFVSMWLLHIAVDVLLFIVRLAHHYMSAFGGDN